MEEATPEKSAGDLAFEAELSGDDQQEVSYVNGQGWQLKNYHPNPNKESEQLPADTPAVERNTEPAVGTSLPGPEQPAEAVRPIPEVVPPREYIPKVPYPVPAKATHDLAAKVDQLLKRNQSQVFIMEEATPEKSAGDLAFEAELSGDDQQEHKESEQLPADTPAAERNTEPAVGTSSPGPEQPAEAVRPIPKVVPPREYIPQVPYPVPAKATHDLDAKVDQLLKGNQSQVFIMEEATPEKSAGDLAFEAELSGDDQQEKESEQLPTDTPVVERNSEPAVGTSSPGPEQPAEAVRPIPEVVPPREYIPKVHYPIPAKATCKDREEMKRKKML
ncbi:hypothetical protein F2Q69_00054606 [Brassica cretica]|uniref:Uncharacterized protein n=1 Tax=Brassica cretica TaxID=69181 RepID=A0A8S9N7F4_BRACR|nr:hypothetical protein F2Q69_00054606 [Brassica cretica]